MEVLTCHVGSWPKPRALAIARARHAEGELDDASLRALEDEVAGRALSAQVERGLREVTDGHPDRGDLVGGFALALDGVESAGLVRVLGSRYVLRPRIVAAPRRVAAVTVSRFRAAAAATDRTVRATLPSPYTLALGCLDEVHDHRAAAIDAFAAVLVDEVRDLVGAGARSIQIDEIALGVDGADTPHAVEAIGRIAAAAQEVDAAASVRLRLAYVPFAPVAEALYGLPLAGLNLAWSSLDPDGLARLADAPRGFDLGVGAVAGDDPAVEPLATIGERVRSFAAAARRERVWLHADAGFQGLDERSAVAKLDAIAAAAGG